MEKYEEASKKEQFDKALKERGTKYLNDLIIKKGNYDRVSRDFTCDIIEMGKQENSDKALKTLKEYTSVADMLEYSFSLYKRNIDWFRNTSLASK